MGEAHPTGLGHQSLDDVLVAVTEVGDEHAARAVDVALARRVVEMDAFAAVDGRIVATQFTLEDRIRVRTSVHHGLLALAALPINRSPVVRPCVRGPREPR
jgi:hypothetical protein